MDTDEMIRIAEFFKNYSEHIEDIRIGSEQDRIFFKGEEREEWYAGENDWHYVNAIPILVRKQSPFMSKGWQQSADPYYVGYIFTEV